MGVETSPVAIQSGTSYSAELFRRGTFGFQLARSAASVVGSVAGGVVNLAIGDLIMSPPGSGMSVNIAVGEAIVPGSSTTTQSGYYLRVSGSTNLSVAASNPSNPRVDLVCASINDAAYTGSSNNGVLAVVTGTPTSGATLSNLTGAPALPTSSLLIGYILVPANASNIIAGDLGDHRVQVSSSLPAGAGQGIINGGLSGAENVNVVASAGSVTTLAATATAIGNDITLTSGDNLTVTMPAVAQGGFCWARVRQPSSGTTTNTVTFTSVKWPAGTAPTMSTGASVVDFYQFLSDGTAWEGFIGGQNIH
jgi:hypothetical protein